MILRSNRNLSSVGWWRATVSLTPLLLAATATSCWQQKQEPVPTQQLEIVEGYPKNVLDSMEAARPKDKGLFIQYVIQKAKKWEPGQKLTVAFNGGDLSLYRDVESAAVVWTATTSLSFNFRQDTATETYRQWHTTDKTRAADIRIAFGPGGYWSCIGTDSIKPACAQANAASLNLQGFVNSRPAAWKAIVTHEFGHALGFAHEHQNPNGNCTNEIRWDDDPGYRLKEDSLHQAEHDDQGLRPGVYTVLKHAPNYWDETTTRRNIGQLPTSRAFPPIRTENDTMSISPFDNQSIMIYNFQPWLFKKGVKSPCYHERNSTLSTLDIKGISETYPKDHKAQSALLKGDERLLRNANRLNLPSDYRDLVNEELSAVKKAESVLGN